MASPKTYYESVHLALIQWHEAGTGSRIGQELVDLRHALMAFNFQPYDIRIQRRNAQESLKHGLMDFCKKVASKKQPCLAILIYGGHGGGTGTRGELILSSHDR